MEEAATKSERYEQWPRGKRWLVSSWPGPGDTYWTARGCWAMKSLEWQAKEMRFGWGILSKQMTCLDFTFMKLTLTTLYQTVAKLDHRRHDQSIPVTPIIIAANIQCCSDSGGDDKTRSSTMTGLGRMPSLNWKIRFSYLERSSPILQCTTVKE